MTNILESCLNNWIDSGHIGRKENFDIVLVADGLDVYLNKDVNSPMITLRIEDTSGTFQVFKAHHIQKLCGARFKFYPPGKFVYYKHVSRPEMISVLEQVDACKKDFFTFIDHFRKHQPDLERRMNKACYKSIGDLSSFQKDKRIYLEISQDEYISLAEQSPPNNFKPFILCGKVEDEDYIFVDLYLVVESKNLSLVRSSSMLYTSLSDLIQESSEVVNNFTLNLEN